MIDFLEGTIEEITEKYLLLNVNGTGYGITITAAAYDRLRREEGAARVYTYMSVSDNGVALYGFSNQYTLRYKPGFLKKSHCLRQ